MIGSALGVILLGGAPESVVTAVLAFGSIALLYLVTAELLVSVRNVPETPWHTLVLFSGFILVFVLEMLVHRRPGVRGVDGRPTRYRPASTGRRFDRG